MGRARREFSSSDYADRIAARLRELREKRGWSVDDVVDRLAQHGMETTKATVYKYEAGRNSSGLDLPLNAIPAFAAVFGVPVAKFMPPAVSQDSR